jgi:hypothetical protein
LTRISLIIIFLYFFKITISFAEPVLTDEESNILNSQCSSQHQKSEIENIRYESQAYGWKASIIEINNSGALIKAHIQKQYKVKSGGKKGWGNETTTLKSEFITCIFVGVSKGTFNVQPDFSIFHYPNNKRMAVYGHFLFCPTEENFIQYGNMKCEWKYDNIPYLTQDRVPYWRLEIKKELFEYKKSYIKIFDLPVKHPKL